MRALLLLFLCGCAADNSLPACQCPEPSLPDLSTVPDLSVVADLAPRPDLTAPRDMARPGDMLNSPQISEVLPFAPVRVGDTVQLLGRDFGCVRSYCNLSVDGANVAPEPGATESALQFKVPLVNLTGNGKFAELSLYNGSGFDRRQLAIIPTPVLPMGELDIFWRGTDRDSIDIGQTTKLRFQVRSRANVALPVAITVSPSSSSLIWALSDVGGMLQPNGTRDFEVSLTPSTLTTASLRLRARGGPLAGFFNLSDLVVNASLPPHDFDVDLRGLVARGRSSVDDLLAVDATDLVLRVTGEVRAAGTWTLSAAVSSADWSVTWSPATPQFVVGNGDLGSGTALRQVSLTVHRLVSDAASANLTITAQGPNASRQLRYRLVAVDP